MPVLQRIGKEQIVKHHFDVPLRVLKKKYTYPETQAKSENMMIHGDNLEALKALLPRYEGKVKCVYIDPPYNTGNEGRVYNDSVNHPKIKRWLHSVVGKEGEDFSRHDKWLCMMYPRLQLLHKLLKEDGVIFISIDDNEQANLRLMMDEIFGPSNFIINFVWKKKKKPAFLSKQVGGLTEYVMCYGKNKKNVEPFTSKTFVTTNGKKYPINNAGNSISTITFPIGSVSFGIDDIIVKAQDMSENNIITKLLNDVSIVDGVNENEFSLEGERRYNQTTLNTIIENEEVISIAKVPFRPNHLKQGGNPKKIHNLLDKFYWNIQTNEDATATLQEIFGRKVFDFSKPANLVEFLIDIATQPGDIILDSFAGSGTTAHAVLNLNKQDGGNRKYILIELMDYAETITAERIKRVIQGYGTTEGTAGDFCFYEIGDTLFDETKNLNATIPIETIREYIRRTETRSHYNQPSCDHPTFLGTYQASDYYFNYDPHQKTEINYDYLKTLLPSASTQIILYADVCSISLPQGGSTRYIFKKIPRDITKL